MKAIHNIVILGGGTSAWMTAAYFSHNFPSYNITVVDKEAGNPVGVGEATLLNFKPFMEACGFDFNNVFTSVDATYKAGILFPNWVRKGNSVWHPFAMNPRINGDIFLHDLWSVNQEYDFKHYGLELYDVTVNHNKIDKNLNHAYHVDCGKLVKFIQQQIVDKKVSLVQSEMISINRAENNDVTSIVLKNGQTVVGDLFVDCTGFLGLLNFNPDRNDLSDRLICDTAVAGHVPYIDRASEQTPYVICDAVECGWIWNIPVNTRIGSGLVFNRSVTDPEDAKKHFCEYWNNRITPDKLKVIDWTPYYNNNPWHENVVAVGLSAGFIEPLESTGIALIMEGIHQLARRIADRNYSEIDATIYNSNMKSFFEESINFVSMHYSYTERTEPFWQQVKKQIGVNAEQQFYLDQLANPNIPMPRQGKDTHFFTGNNWNTWLIQMGFPVAPRRLEKESARTAIVKRYEIEERDRHIWGLNHVDYIDRIYRLESLK
jgi:tryptophan halogenase